MSLTPEACDEQIYHFQRDLFSYWLGYIGCIRFSFLSFLFPFLAFCCSLLFCFELLRFVISFLIFFFHHKPHHLKYVISSEVFRIFIPAVNQLLVDIYLAAWQPSEYPTLATEVNNCFNIYAVV